MFMIPLLLTMGWVQGSPHSVSLKSCLGHWQTRNPLGIGSIVCDIEDAGSRWYLCQASIWLSLLLVSNIPEAFMLYRCFQKIKKGTDQLQELLGHEAYLSRRRYTKILKSYISFRFTFFREHGVIISISICQWALEVVHLFVCQIYLFFVLGQNEILDKIFHLYIGTFSAILQPSFYLMGDKAFRNDLSNKGLISALKTALMDR